MVDEEPDDDRPRRAVPEDRGEKNEPEQPKTPATPAQDSLDEPPSDESGDETSANEPTQVLSRDRGRARGRESEGRRETEAEATTMLPRAASRTPISPADDTGEDSDDDTDEENARGGRSRRGLLIGVVAAVVIAGLAVGYVILALTRPSAAPGIPPVVPSASVGPSSGMNSTPPAAEPSEVLTDAALLSPRSAAKIDPSRIWKVALTQKGESANSPQPACLGGNRLEGQPVPQQSLLQVLNSNGKNPPAALQQADVYASPEEAAQAYAAATRALGNCAMPATFITSGALITGLGDQALGVVLNVADGNASEFRTVVLSRTGRVTDVVDVAQRGAAVGVDKVALATGDAINVQCKVAVGACATAVATKAAPPPAAGDVPGFLAASDLPPVGTGPISWVGNKPAAPDSDVLKGSGCETVDWAKQAAVTRSWRTYLLENSTSKFGLDEVILTTKSPAEAAKLVDKVRKDWADCSKRVLTATVEKAQKVSAVGAQNIAIGGWTTLVSQDAGNATTRFRVGIAAAGTKVVFTFVNPQDKLDFSHAEFAHVTARAAQRATQVK
jgi:hypothetical protein